MKDIWSPPAYDEAPDCRFRMMWYNSDTCNARCTYCFAKDSHRRIREERKRWWTQEDVDRAWKRAFDALGPCYVEMSGAEPTCYPKHILSLWRIGHTLQICSNLKVAPSVLEEARADPSRIKFATSFHPLEWGFDAFSFLDQVRRYQDVGFHIMGTSIVAHPIFLPHMDRWLDLFEEKGLYAVPHPFGGEYRGKHYPASYTEEESSWLSKRMRNEDRVECIIRRTRDENYDRCAAGWKYLMIDIDGTVCRCVKFAASCILGQQDDGMDTSHNFFREGVILNDGPRGCEHLAYCPCDNYYRYHIGKGATVIDDEQQT